MSPQNLQTVYTVIDCLSALLPLVVLGYLTVFGVAGIFAGGARVKVAGNPFWCLVWTASLVWIALRLYGVIA